MRRKLGEILLSSGMVGPGDIAEALADQSSGEPSRLGDLLVAAGKLTPAQLAQALAVQYGVPYTTLPPLTSEVLEVVPLDFQRAHRLVPLRVEGEVLSIAMADLADTDAVRKLQETWPQVKVFAAPGDEIDALHSSLCGEFPGPPPLERPGVAPPVAAARGNSLSADDLFGSLELEGQAPAATEPTVSGLFGDLDLEGLDESPAATPSGSFERSAGDGAGASADPSGSSGSFSAPLEDAPRTSGPSGLFELAWALDEAVTGDTPGEVPARTAEVRVPDEASDSEEEDLFFEARLSSPGPGSVAPPPTIPPLALEPPRPGENVAPLERQDSSARPTSGPTVFEQLFGSSDASVREPEPRRAPPSKAAPAPEQRPPEPPAPPVTMPRAPPGATVAMRPAAKQSAGAEATSPEAEPAKATPVTRSGEPRPALQKPGALVEDGLSLPDWLRDETASPPAPVGEGTDLWTGELEALAPSKLITGVARALIRKGLLTEQEVLAALERKKP
jgi:hypothetical protein